VAMPSLARGRLAPGRARGGRPRFPASVGPPCRRHRFVVGCRRLGSHRPVARDRLRRGQREPRRPVRHRAPAPRLLRRPRERRHPTRPRRRHRGRVVAAGGAGGRGGGHPRRLPAEGPRPGRARQGPPLPVGRRPDGEALRAAAAPRGRPRRWGLARPRWNPHLVLRARSQRRPRRRAPPRWPGLQRLRLRGDHRGRHSPSRCSWSCSTSGAADAPRTRAWS